jgi:hypothetical protein
MEEEVFNDPRAPYNLNSYESSMTLQVLQDKVKR